MLTVKFMDICYLPLTVILKAISATQFKDAVLNRASKLSVFTENIVYSHLALLLVNFVTFMDITYIFTCKYTYIYTGTYIYGIFILKIISKFLPVG